MTVKTSTIPSISGTPTSALISFGCGKKCGTEQSFIMSTKKAFQKRDSFKVWKCVRVRFPYLNSTRSFRFLVSARKMWHDHSSTFRLSGEETRQSINFRNEPPHLSRVVVRPNRCSCSAICFHLCKNIFLLFTISRRVCFLKS